MIIKNRWYTWSLSTFYADNVMPHEQKRQSFLASRLSSWGMASLNSLICGFSVKALRHISSPSLFFLLLISYYNTNLLSFIDLPGAFGKAENITNLNIFPKATTHTTRTHLSPKCALMHLSESVSESVWTDRLVDSDYMAQTDRHTSYIHMRRHAHTVLQMDRWARGYSNL